jgi:Tfp pilus assembly protein PilE
MLLALSSFNPALEELRQALQRPYARMPMDYNNGFDAVGDVLPYLASMKQCAQFLQLRTLAELDDGQSQPALDDIKLLLGLNDSIRDQPYLISHLVRIAIVAITLQPVYEGLARQRWSDAQLMELEQALAKMDFLEDFENAAKGEEIFAIQEFEKQRITRKSSQFEPSNGTNKLATISYRVMPSAYFYQNELAFAQMHRQYVLPLIDLTNRIVAPSALRESSAAIQSQMKHSFAPYKVQAVMAFPGISACVMKTARIQSQVDLARVAIALERYRLAHGNYPETLDALAPQFIALLPHDIINGQPLHYRLSNDGQFVLYSVGWNETDDSGVAGLTANGKSLDSQTGDWVWHYSLPQN